MHTSIDALFHEYHTSFLDRKNNNVPYRVANVEDSTDVRVTADAMQIEAVVAAPVVAVPLLLLLLIGLLVHTRKRKDRR